MSFRLMTLICCTLACPSGCTAPDRAPARAAHLANPGDLRMDGDVTTWDALVDRAAASHVVLLGEQHDDSMGHAVQLALVQALLERCPDAAVALEMLERDEQPLVADYRDGVIDAEDFAKATGSAAWAGKGSWTAWYQPVVDAAITADVPLIAANAPRRYVRHARTDGFAALTALDEPRRAWVDVPDPPLDGDYKERFFNLMGDGHDVDEATIEAFFRAQSVWDATMAASVVQAVNAGRAPVVLLLGRFHSDHEGGTRMCIARALPDARILSISLEPGTPEHDEALPKQADVIVFTGD